MLRLKLILFISILLHHLENVSFCFIPSFVEIKKNFISINNCDNQLYVISFCSRQKFCMQFAWYEQNRMFVFASFEFANDKRFRRKLARNEAYSKFSILKHFNIVICTQMFRVMRFNSLHLFSFILNFGILTNMYGLMRVLLRF